MSMYPRLDYARFTPTTLDIEESLIVQVLKNSKGERTMSDEDVKLALLSLFSTCKFQQELIDELVNCVNELRKPKKKSWQFWK